MSGTSLSKLAAATLCFFIHHSNDNLSNNFSTVSSFVYPKSSTIPSSTRPPAANWIDEKPPLLFWNQLLLSSPSLRSTPHQGNLQAARKPNQNNNYNRKSNGDQSSPSKRLPNPDKLTKEEKEQSLQYLASLIKRRLRQVKEAKQSALENDVINDLESKQRENIEGVEFVTEEEDVAYQLARGRFIDLATTVKGEKILENMFRTPVALAASESPTSAADDMIESKDANNEITGNNDDNTIQTPSDPRLIKHAITSLQSLILYAMQIGIKGPTEMQNKLVRHLFRPGDAPQEESGTWIPEWNGEAIRRFKFFRDTELGKDVLAALIWKRTAQGARDLMVELGVWGRHEDTALLRSGFPIRFLEEEERVSKEVCCMHWCIGVLVS